MPPPQAIVCDLCGGKYFKRSFPIHLKQCQEKFGKQVRLGVSLCYAGHAIRFATPMFSLVSCFAVATLSATTLALWAR